MPEIDLGQAENYLFFLNGEYKDGIKKELRKIINEKGRNKFDSKSVMMIANKLKYIESVEEFLRKATKTYEEEFDPLAWIDERRN